MTTSRSKKAASKKVSTLRRQSAVLAKADAAVASDLVRDLSAMIEAAQRQVATVANAALTTLHWQNHGPAPPTGVRQLPARL